MTKLPLTPLAIAALTLGLAAPASVLAQSAAPAKPPVPAATPIKGPVVKANTLSMTGEVTAIDRAQRTVVVRDEQGRVATLMVGPNVRNFDAIDKGDEVTARYTEAVSLAIAKGGTGSGAGVDVKIGEIRTKVEADAARQANDGMPGMAATERTILVANVFQIDRKRGVLMLRGTDGVPVEIKVPEAALDQLALDDQVVIGYRQAAVVSIEPGDAGSATGQSDPTAAPPSR